ncbi:CPBP family intramembrane glutamic endopeptidase [Ferruginibacter sp.]|nr:CPBP family intramembrane metalloprotease [Ferruginibacter sp.]
MAFSFTKSFIAGKFERTAHGVIGTMAALLTTYLFLKFDKKSFTVIGLNFEKATLKKFVAGVLIGIGIMGLLTISVIYFSGFTITANTNSSMLNFLYYTLPLIPLAFMEELGFRAYPLVLLKDKTGIRNSIIITSILFALYHLVNGWTIQNSFLGAGVWGIVYGLAAIYSNGISMPTGMHYAANLTTTAFGISDDSFNLWTLKQHNGLSLENYQSSQLATLIPQISLLISGVLCMEWYLRKKNYR